MELTDKQLQRIEELRERQQLNIAFVEALIRFRQDHQDIKASQYERWEQYLVEKDDLALGAVIALMDVRDSRRRNKGLIDGS